MAKYDILINNIIACMAEEPIDKHLLGELIGKSIITIRHLQSIVRDYNPDDAIFDDEKQTLELKSPE